MLHAIHKQASKTVPRKMGHRAMMQINPTVVKGSMRAAAGGIPWRKRLRVSWCDATHCSSASALHTRLEACAVRAGGVRSG